MTKRRIIIGGDLEEAAKRVAEAWHRAERGETVEPEDNVTFAPELHGGGAAQTWERETVAYNGLMEDRQALHTLVDELLEPELRPARRFLEYLRHQPADSLRLLLETAPLDDEPVTEDDLAAIREGLEEYARGETIPHEEVKRLLRETK